MLEMMELRVLKISPGSEEEGGGVGGIEIGGSEDGVGSTTWLVMESTWLVTEPMSLATDPTMLVRSLTIEPTIPVRPPRRPPSSEEDEDAGGGVMEEESDVEVGVPESLMETGSKTLVVDDDGPGSASETTLAKPPPTPSTILETPPSTAPRRPPSLEDEGAGVTEESEAVELNELVSVEAGSELLEVSVDDEEVLLLPLPSPSKSKVKTRNFTPLC